MPSTEVKTDGTLGAIFGRLLENGGTLSPELARYLLGLGFPEEDKARMHELAVKNQGGRLPADEWRELENYLLAGNLLVTLQSKARRALKEKHA